MVEEVAVFCFWPMYSVSVDVYIYIMVFQNGEGVR